MATMTRTLPDMHFAPGWARFAACDEDGTWCWFEHQPWTYDELGRWFPPNRSLRMGEKESRWMLVRGYVTTVSEFKWQDSLMSVPKRGS
jgi:hypothetical protein